jgi:outer membrane protein assembly factor BamB
VANGRVYVTASSGYQQDRLHVLCFDQTSGAKLWERQFWATGSTTCHPKTAIAGPTPVTDGGHVYALFSSGDLTCLDRDGNLVWYRALGRDYPGIANNLGLAASPTVAGDLLFLPLENVGDSFAAALDKRTGETRWKVERYRDINWVTPLFVESGKHKAVLFQTAKEITAYDADTGKSLWSHAGGLSSVASPLLAEGLILVSGGEFTALKAGFDSSAAEVAWKSNRIKTSYASPVFHQGRIYTINSAGILSCSDASDGRSIWQQRLKGVFWASPIIAGDKLYLPNEEGTTFVLQLGDEPKVVAENPLGETMLATPAIANGAIFLRSDQVLFCIAKKKP